MLSIIIISLLGIIVYSNTFSCSFHLDDLSSIVNNPLIRNIHHLQSIWNFLPRRFLTYLSLAFNYHLNGLNVGGYHLFNLGVHLVSAMLVYWLTRLSLSTPALREEKIARHADFISLSAGLIFVAHPLQTEAVTYIIQRAASLATLFYLAALCFYVKFRLLSKFTVGAELVSGHSIGRVDRHSVVMPDTRKSSQLLGRTQGPPLLLYFCSLITAIMAMFTKEMTITLPFMILLYEFIFFKKNANLRWAAPFLLTLSLIPLTMYFTESAKAQQARGVLADLPSGISTMHYLMTEFRVMCTYLRLVFLPINQNLDYDYSISKSVFELPVILSFSLVVLILYCAKRLFSKYRLLSFSIFWLFLTLLPESSIFPIRDVIFEHRLYLPMAGVSIFLASAIYYLLEKYTFKTVGIVLFGIISCYSILTYYRNMVWKNDYTLWSDTAVKSPHKARPHNNLGLAYLNQGMYVKASAEFKAALEIDPQYLEANINLGIADEKLGKLGQAAVCFTRAIDIRPDSAMAFFERGLVYSRQGQFIQAVSDYNRAISLNPNDARGYIERGLVFARHGNRSEAFFNFTKAIQLAPEAVEAYNDRGIIEDSQNHFVLAIADYDRAVAINPEYAQAYFNRAITFYHLKAFDKAWGDVKRAQESGFMGNARFVDALKTAWDKAK